MGHIICLRKCALAAITLVGGGAGDGGLELEPECEGGLLPFSAAVIFLSGQGLVPSSWSRSSEVWSLPFRCVFPSPQSKDMLKHMGPL